MARQRAPASLGEARTPISRVSMAKFQSRQPPEPQIRRKYRQIGEPKQELVLSNEEYRTREGLANARPGRAEAASSATDEILTITNYPGLIRQLIVRGLGRETPTVIITNDRASTARQIIERYARRMTIEQRLAEAIRAFHLDALASAVPLNVDLDVLLSALAGAVSASLRRRLGAGYRTATPDTLQRRFLHTGGTIINREDGIVVRLDRRTYSPVLRSADIPQVAVPWWGGRTLRFDYA